MVSARKTPAALGLLLRGACCRAGEVAAIARHAGKLRRSPRHHRDLDRTPLARIASRHQQVVEAGARGHNEQAGGSGPPVGFAESVQVMLEHGASTGVQRDALLAGALRRAGGGEARKNALTAEPAPLRARPTAA